MFLATDLAVRVGGESSEEEEKVIFWKISTFAQHRVLKRKKKSFFGKYQHLHNLDSVNYQIILFVG